MTNNNWCVVFNKMLGIYIAVSFEDKLGFLKNSEDLIRTNLTKAQALQKANTMNEIIDRAEELLCGQNQLYKLIK